MAERTEPGLRNSFKRLITLAVILHLSLTVIIYLAGRFAVFPGAFDANGVGVFAPDGYVYQTDARSLAELLAGEEIDAWLAAPCPLHIKIYSVSFAIFGPWFGFNILSAELLNVVYYLLVLSLIFSLGRELFDRRVGILAALIVAVWPSFLIHTTQLLKDPLFIAAMLALVFIITTWLTRAYSWRMGLAVGAAGGAVEALLWLVRREMWEVILAVVFLGIVLLALRQFNERRLLVGNVAGAALLLTFTVSVPPAVAMFRTRGLFSAQPAASASAEARTLAVCVQPNAPTTPAEKRPPTGGLDLVGRIGWLRNKFILQYPNASSNVDAEVQLIGTAEIARYLPRAMAVGFFAPFPRMWFASGGQVGLTGRLLGGLETLLMYLIDSLAVLSLWQRRRYLPVWLLFLIAAAGVTALGLVVVNVGALYRMRYVFWMLLVILGAEGGVQAVSMLGLKKRPEI